MQVLRVSNQSVAQSARADKPSAVKEALQVPAEAHAWAKSLTTAVKREATTGQAVLSLILEAREAGYPETFVRETVKAAYVATGCNPETARKRGSDAITVFRSTLSAEELPKGVQHAASAVRKEKSGTQRAPRQPAAKGTSKTVSPLHAMAEIIEALRSSTKDADALGIIADMADLCTDLADIMASNTAKAVN